MRTDPSGLYLRYTIGIRIYHVVIATVWAGVAAAAASAATYTGTGVASIAIDVARDPSVFAPVEPPQTWSLVFVTIFAALVAAGMIALAWQRLAAAVRPISESPDPAPSGSATVYDGRSTSAP